MKQTKESIKQNLKDANMIIVELLEDDVCDEGMDVLWNVHEYLRGEYKKVVD